MSRKESKEAVRKRVAAWRAKQKGKDAPESVVTPELHDVTPTVTNTKPIKGTGVTQEDILGLPLSLRFQLDAITRSRKILKFPDNLRERQEIAVRKFRGY